MNLKYFYFLTSFFTLSLSAVEVGQAAPDFKLQDDTGATRTLAEFKDKKLVLFFYPKDNSPICKSQVRGLRDSFTLFEKNNIVLLGINYDTPESHKNFKTKNNLQFNLLSDPVGSTAKAYGADRAYLLNFVPKRRTYLIENGKIKAIIKDVDTKTHALDILKAFNA